MTTIDNEENMLPLEPEENLSIIPENPSPAMHPVAVAAEEIRQEMSKVLIGQNELIQHLLTGLFAGGHMLIEGVPGIAKTLTSRLLAKCLSLDYSRSSLPI